MGRLITLLRRRGLAPGTRLLYDTFTDANGTLLPAHTMDTGPGWTQLTAGGSIQGNRFSGNASGECAYSAEAGAANVVATAVFNVVSLDANHGPGLILRASNKDNWWLCMPTGDGNHYLYEQNAGTYTVRASGTWSADLADHTLTATATDTTVTSRVDAGTPISYGSAALNQTVTRHGLRLYSSGGIGAATLDTLEVTS